MNKKLEPQHKHVMRLIARDCGLDGWAKVSAVLYPHLSENMSKELVEFKRNDDGSGFARLTEKGNSILMAMEYL